jgi:ferredoxin like protein
MKQTLEDKLGLLKYNIDKLPHIVINKDACELCDTKPCVAGCPAGCFSIEEGKLHFQYENCIECGTCKIVCPKDAVEWNYPRGTFGVSYKLG